MKGVVPPNTVQNGSVVGENGHADKNGRKDIRTHNLHICKNANKKSSTDHYSLAHTFRKTERWITVSYEVIKLFQ